MFLVCDENSWVNFCNKMVWQCRDGAFPNFICDLTSFTCLHHSSFWFPCAVWYDVGLK